MIFRKTSNGVAYLLSVADISLVDDQDGGNVGGFKTFDQFFFYGTDSVACFNEQQNDIYVGSGTVCNLHHVRTELILRLVDTGRIEKNELRFFLGKDARDFCSGGLGLGRYDGYVFTEELIQKGGFSDIGSADQCRKKIFFHIFNSFSLLYFMIKILLLRTGMPNYLRGNPIFTRTSSCFVFI